MLFSKKVLCFYLCIGMVLIPFLASDELFAKKKAATKIVHSPIKYFVSGSRVSVNAQVTDPDGIMLVRCYFRAEGAADFVFVDMTSSADEYEGILPAPSPNTDTIEYLVLAVTTTKWFTRPNPLSLKNRESRSDPHGRILIPVKQFK